MTFQRSRWSCNRPVSIAYLEILLEALTVLVIATELSLDCAGYFFPEWHEHQFFTRPKTGLAHLFLGTWQLSSKGLHTSSNTIDRVSMSLGNIILISTAGAFYLVFAVFLYVNRTWRPPVFRGPSDKDLVFLQMSFSAMLLFVSIPQAMATIYLVMKHTGWFSFISGWMTFTVLAFVYFSGIMCSILLFLLEHFIQCWDQRKAEDDMRLCESTEHPTMLCEKQNTVGMCGYIIQKAFDCIMFIARFVMVHVLFVTVLVVFAITPAVPAMVCAGLTQCLMAFCGATVAFYGCVVLACLLAMYSSGRMLGLWMIGSNVAWAIDKTRWLAGFVDGLQEIFPSQAVQGISRECRRTKRDKRCFDLAMDWAIISVLSCTVWSACTSGIIRAYGDTGALEEIQNWTLPECTSSMLSQLWTGANINTTCVLLNSTIAPLQTRLVAINYLISDKFRDFTYGGFQVTMLLMSCILAGVTVAAINKCFGRKKHVSEPVSTEEEYTKMTNRAFAVLYLAPLSLVKIVLIVYGLDFLLPGRFYALGLTGCLVAYTALFWWKFVKMVVDWMKSLFANGVFSRRGENIEIHVIGMDDHNILPTKLEVLA